MYEVANMLDVLKMIHVWKTSDPCDKDENVETFTKN